MGVGVGGGGGGVGGWGGGGGGGGGAWAGAGGGAWACACARGVVAWETRLRGTCVVADAKPPVRPCGGCRQKLAEFAAGGDTKITRATLDGARLTMTMAELLPGAFGTDHMDTDHQDRD